MSKIFTLHPEELYEHSLWKNASNDYRSVLTVILRHTAFEDMPTIGLLKGQCCRSLRLIAEEAQVAKSTASDAIQYFMGFTSKSRRVRGMDAGEARLLVGHNSGHNSGQEKHIYNIMLKLFYDNSRTESRTESRTAFRTDSGQIPDSSPREKANTYIEAKKYVIETTTSASKNAQDDVASFDQDKAKAMLAEFWTAWEQTKEKQSYYLKKGISHCFLALTYISREDFIIKTTAIQAYVWAFNTKPWLNEANQPKQLSNRERIMQYFSDGEIYNGAKCEINATGISFHRGFKTGGANFEASTCMATLANVLDNFGLDNPFKIKLKQA